MNPNTDAKLWALGALLMAAGIALIGAALTHSTTWVSTRGERMTIRWDGQPLNYRR